MKSFIPPIDYLVPDPFHVDRWMCPRCGLIFDFLFDPEGNGWPRFEPPLDEPDYWYDDQGEIHSEEPERSEFCPRCDLPFEDASPLRVSVALMTSLQDLIPVIMQGEGRTIDFMVEFPGNASHLRDAIAAFATTEGGRVFLGVNNQGDVVGLPNLEQPQARDNLQQRIRGLLGSISPRPEVRIDFFSDDRGACIAVITIPKGPSPIYLSGSVPYIRDMDQSRPATAEEIQRLVGRPGPRDT